MFYIMGDIHGCFHELKKRLDQIDLCEGDKLIFLGDYIDYGTESARVIRTIIDLEKTYKAGTVIALKGNHEDYLISWLKECRRMSSGDYCIENDWLGNDRANNYCTFRTMVTKDQMTELIELEKKISFTELNIAASKMITKTSGDIIQWIKGLSPYYETESQIFVHAGVDEEAEDLWQVGTSDEMFMYKYPPTVGDFYKTIIAGHVGTCDISGNKDFHDIYYDGKSHYYVDGTVYRGGRLCLLAFDDRDNSYYEIDDNGKKIKIAK